MEQSRFGHVEPQVFRENHLATMKQGRDKTVVRKSIEIQQAGHATCSRIRLTISLSRQCKMDVTTFSFQSPS